MASAARVLKHALCLQEGKVLRGRVDGRQITTAGFGTGSDEQPQQQALPRVALMFLSRGPMPHEPSWQLFFEAAGDLTRGKPA